MSHSNIPFISMYDNAMLNVAVHQLREHEFDQSINHHLCAIIVKGGRILSIGFNSHKKDGAHGLQRRWKPPSQYVVSIHAEVDAVLNVRRKVDLTDTKVYIARKHRHDCIMAPSLVLSKPCPMCQAVLFSYGVRRVTYTVDNNTYGVMRVTDPRE